MKLAWMAEDIAGARRATSFLVALLVGSMLVNLVLAIFAIRLAGHERIVVVPPNIHKTFWVESDRVSSAVRSSPNDAGAAYCNSSFAW